MKTAHLPSVGISVATMLICIAAISCDRKAAQSGKPTPKPSFAVRPPPQDGDVIDLRQDRAEPVAATIQQTDSTDLKTFDGKVVTISGLASSEKDAVRFRLKDAWVDLPESCRPDGASAHLTVTGRLTLGEEAHYYKSPNDSPGNRVPVQDRGSGWYPERFRLGN
jgi:hypothetical protein